MKLALCICGILRDWEQSFNILKDKILEGHEVDLFIHTWDNDGSIIDDKFGSGNHPLSYNLSHIKRGDVIDETFIVEESMKSIDRSDLYKDVVEFVKGMTKNVIYKSESQEKVLPDLVEIKERLINYRYTWSPYSFCSHLYSMYESDKLKNEYAKLNNIEYDLTIRTRTELYPLKKIDNNFLKEIKNSGNIAIPMGGDYNTGINFDLAIGNSDAINWYCSIKNYLQNYSGGQHKILSKHLNEKYKDRIDRWDFPYKVRDTLISKDNVR